MMQHMPQIFQGHNLGNNSTVTLHPAELCLLYFSSLNIFLNTYLTLHFQNTFQQVSTITKLILDEYMYFIPNLILKTVCLHVLSLDMH